MKNAEPVVFATAALVETGNSSSASIGGTNLPLRRNGCSAAADAASKEIADTSDHFMTDTEDLEKLEPRDVEEGQTKEGKRVEVNTATDSPQVFIHFFSLGRPNLLVSPTLSGRHAYDKTHETNSI